MQEPGGHEARQIEAKMAMFKNSVLDTMAALVPESEGVVARDHED